MPEESSPLLPVSRTPSSRRRGSQASPRRVGPPPLIRPAAPRTYNHRLPIVGCFLLAWLLLAFHSLRETQPLEERITPAPGISISLLAQGFFGARTLVRDHPGSLLVLTTGTRSILRVDIATGMKRTILDWTTAELHLNHGLELVEWVNGTYLIASSADTVYGWNYDGSPVDLEEGTMVFVKNINGASGGEKGHETRSLIFEASTGYLYVSIGSLSNVDSNSNAARIVRFKIVDVDGALCLPESGEGFDFVQDGEIWADGIRNSVAQAFDSRGILWEANNGPDKLARTHFPDPNSNQSLQAAATAIDFHNDNPVEEINRLDKQGGFFGYPFCFTAGNFTSSFDNDPMRGTQWAWNEGNSVWDDQWCRNKEFNIPPHGHLPAHSAPISMLFLKEGDGCGKIRGVSFPCSMVGNLIITLHGSWNRDVPAGFQVIMVPFSKNFPTPSKNQLNSVIKLFEAKEYQTNCAGMLKASSCFRPTGIAILRDRGTLAVVSDTTGELVEVAFSKSYDIPKL